MKQEILLSLTCFTLSYARDRRSFTRIETPDYRVSYNAGSPPAQVETIWFKPKEETPKYSGSIGNSKRRFELCFDFYSVK